MVWPSTIIDIAGQIGHELPETDPGALGRWFVEACDSGSLERYLETFAHTVAVMQRPDDLRRVARECVEDLAAAIEEIASLADELKQQAA